MMRASSIAALALLGLLLPTSAGWAKSDFEVNSTGDAENDGCDVGLCTLREAAQHVSAGEGKSIGCDVATFPPGSGTQVNLTTSPVVVTVSAGFTLDCTGRSIIVDGEQLRIVSGAGNPLSNVTIKNVAFGQWLRICGGDGPGSCDQPVSKIALSGLSLPDDDVDVIGSSVSGVTVSDSVAYHLNVDAEAGDASNITVIDGHFRAISVAANEAASKVKIVGNSATADIEFDAGEGARDVIISDNDVAYEGISVEAGSLSKVSITKNRAHSDEENQDGIYVYSSGPIDKLRVESNLVTADEGEDTGDGIELEAGAEMKNVKLSKNTVHGFYGNGIYVDASGSTSGVQVVGNTSFHNEEDGIELDDFGGKKTKVQGNVANDNGDSGIRPRGSLFDVSKNRALGNDNSGIDGWDADDSSFKKNVARGSGSNDVSDQDSCATNTWKGNTFLTSHDPCIE